MTIADPQDPSIVIRIVYDGPPEVGKTTSVRALAEGFGREVYTPEEQDGRTVFFDWLEHTGGRFDGAPIRCQIASVPGQRRWRRRRFHFIDRADVIVFVGDTSSTGWSESLGALRNLLRRLRRRDGTAVGVVFQANRRDAPDALPLASVREQIAEPTVAVIESIAIEGSGVREAFVFAVRLALDRVREEQRLGRMPPTEAGATADAVLEELLRLDTPPISTVDVASDPSARPAITQPTASGGPRTPSHEMPSGLVWPPIEGRIILRDAAVAGVTGERSDDGDFVAELAPGWYGRSHAAAVFTTLDDGRDQLIAWARAHAASLPLLSRQRCIALVETGDGRWRLWQVVQRHATLRALFDRLDRADGSEMARCLATASRHVTEAQSICDAAGLTLPCTLDTLGISSVGQVVYVGAMPAVAARPSHVADGASIARQLEAVVRAGAVHEVAAVRSAVRHTSASDFGPSRWRTRELLVQMLEE